MQLSFFTGPECCLCDQAKQMFKQLPEYANLTINYINIRDSHDLYHNYGARIPVVMRNDNGAELAWPFDLQQVIKFLND